MKVCHILICFFFLSLQDGNIRLINAEILVHTGSEGGNITVGCSFSFSGSRKIFCKRECEGKDILIETDENRAQNGRYSIEYKEGTFPASKTLLYVSITKLTKSDSGRYRCWLGRAVLKDATYDFELRVEDAPTASKPNWKTTTKAPFTPSVPSASTPTTTQSLSSSSGSSTPSSSSPETPNQPEQQQRAAGPGLQLYVRLTLVVMIIVLSASVLIFCRKRASKPKEPPVETEYANVTETPVLFLQANRVYEEIGEEDRQSRSPPAEISTVYTYAKYSKPNAVETTDEYSLITAAGPQNKTEDDLSKLTYSEVDFSNGAAASLHSAPRGDADNVVYSVPRVAASSHAEDTSPPLYSTVSLHQL
ncbi:uncharacterized protein LOC127376922 isoform X8 [Dicentrarchus labrax]|uniref:uncharacterized protein LOC127376922 isoform X8 n=1 Tax=Dicentrarchus labrax TaxID=13489 RepID=UPI0021F56F60|nr:uncharacterized protein LOC127376922 isoform X8 [Dicentrarchus labrax]XP_051280286.1 uncharacterized protein LOC127376922 isoform X8 [Dicentrarchus labrax]